ncbi:MAG: S8 family serine peptidase [Candidatus Neomarinimicrobiota bacterium]
MLKFLYKPSLTLLLGIIFLSLLIFTGCEQDHLPTQSSIPGERSVEKILPKMQSMDDQSSGRFIVTFKGRPDHAAVQEAGGTVVYSYDIIPAMAVKGPQEFLTNLTANSSVLRIEPDKKVFALDVELDNTWGVKRIGSGAVHAGGNSGSGVKVGILDSGIDYLHEDLNDSYVRGVDFVNNDDDPMDDYGHGTHVAGTVGAEDNGIGVVGVAPGSDLYAIKILNSSGSGYWTDIIAALDWAVTNGIQVTNNSYGASTYPGVAVETAFINSASTGMIHVASAGNSGNPPGRGENIGYPGNFAAVIAVTATDINDKRARFSSTGSNAEIAAPGVNVISTRMGGGYVNYNGTSMASPHVAGTVALALTAGKSVNAVRSLLQTTADDLGDPGWDSQYGFGLVDAIEMAGGTVNQSPVITVTAPGNNSSFGTGVSIDFEGSAWDAEDLDITYKLSWTSSGDGLIGSGGSFDKILSDGNHTITVEVTDSDGALSTENIVVTVGSPPVGLNVDSITPAELTVGTTDNNVEIIGAGFVAGLNVSFENGSGPAPLSSSISIVNETSISLTITVKNGGPPRSRLWDVRVTNPDGSTGVLTDGLMINP